MEGLPPAARLKPSWQQQHASVAGHFGFVRERLRRRSDGSLLQRSDLPKACALPPLQTTLRFTAAAARKAAEREATPRRAPRSESRRQAGACRVQPCMHACTPSGVALCKGLRAKRGEVSRGGRKSSEEGKGGGPPRPLPAKEKGGTSLARSLSATAREAPPNSAQVGRVAGVSARHSSAGGSRADSSDHPKDE